MSSIGSNVPRKESAEKVTGALKYNDDLFEPGMLHGWLVTSSHPHAYIKRLDLEEARNSKGVKAIITGKSDPVYFGPMIEDRPILAIDKVRYFMEPIAIVIADSLQNAKAAANKVNIEYEILPVVNTLTDALKKDAVQVHENLALYQLAVDEVYPEPGTNVASRYKIRKGDMQNAWSQCDTVIEEKFLSPGSDHMAMEPRSAKAEIKPDGRVLISSTTQNPHEVQKAIADFFHVEPGKVTVIAPMLGGAFGGKTTIQIELLAYAASRAVGGKKVRIAFTREMDLITAPVHLNFEGTVKLGATKEGKILAAELYYYHNCGAYSDSAPNMSRAAATSCTGPYNILNVQCDSLCVYTNHPYATAFRGFGHIDFTTAIERSIDRLAFKMGMDPLDLRIRNLIGPGNTSPTMVKLTSSNLGDINKCLQKAAQMINWEHGRRIDLGNYKVLSKGLCCYWKTSSSPVNASSGAILILNSDGSISLNCGVVEFGQSTKTVLAQILAEKMGMSADDIHVVMEVSTEVSPEHWKTVASMSSYMAGNAVLAAADDMIKKIKKIASVSLRCPENDLDVYGGKVFVRYDKDIHIRFKDLSHGIKFENGNAYGEQIIGTGSFVMNRLTPLDRETGAGKPGPYWTVGAGAVEIEYDTRLYTYRLKRAVSVIDAGKVLNPKNAKGVVMGAMCMGLGTAFCEEFIFNGDAIPENTSLRTYKPLRVGEEPEYLVDFVETPVENGPYGARGIAEHATMGMPGALLNSISTAAQIDLNRLPALPETIWKIKTGGAK